MKKILVLQPNYNAISEVWLNRMTEQLQDYIIAIWANNPSENQWKNKIPVFNLLKPRYSIFERVLRRINPRIATLPRVLIEKQMAYWFITSDIVLIHYITTAVEFINVVKKNKKNFFVHVHGYDIFLNTTDINGQLCFSPDYEQKILELSNYVTFIANSEYTKKKILSVGISESKVKIKYFGVPNQELKLKKENKTINILFLGRLVDFKRPDIVIKAFIRACEKGMDGQLMVAGDGEFRVTCELLKRESVFSDRITMLGAVNYLQAEELYKWADIYSMHSSMGIFSNNEEAFGVSMIEAMSYGLPVVTANGGAVNEVVENGVTGVIVKQNDIEAHADAFLTFYKNRELLFEMGQNAQMVQQKKFSLLQEQQQLFEILQIN